MLTMEQLAGTKVFVPRQDKGRAQKDGGPAAPKRYGRVHHVVFAPSGTRVVGVMVKRPDAAGMVKREDEFCALDALSPCDKGLLASGSDAFGAKAAARLGVDLDRCLIWGGMDVVTQSGENLGYVTDFSFDYPSGRVETISVTDGAVAASLVGAVPVTADLLVGYAKGAMVVKDEAKGLQLTGGLAAKAGEGFGKAQQAGKKAAATAGKAAGEALDKGSFALGKAIGSAKRAAMNAVEAAKADEPPAQAPAEPKPPLYVPTGEVSAAPAQAKGQKPAAEPKKTAADKAARTVGKQLGKTKGMFGAFMKEFKEASK